MIKNIFKHKIRGIIAGGIFIILLLALIFSGADSIKGENENENFDKIGIVSNIEEPISRPETGEEVINFTFLDENNQEIQLTDFEDKVIFINFWASWCPPCIMEMPFIQAVHEKYEDNLKVLTINLQEEEKTVKDFMEENDYDFRVVRDKGHLAQVYRVSSIPTSLFIDEDNIIRKRHTGYLKQQQMEDIIEELINSQM